ncbi:hypothetical protein BP5796_06026 [Coleophoma crateriformis]|uniref:Allergen n=1 Tax=Coleophoma crateriformis TaxID=565419 RepID=A0A3D8RWF9_9HELO|nr:hypothetical protein BP5796_06026 [Coleophoma crateriformis]
MQSAKAAVSNFLSRDGKHDTTVHETVNPAVTREHVTRTQHNEAQTVVDKEVHQDHHHTTIQPIKDREVLPEQHSHNLAAVEHRDIKHGDDSHIKERLASEQAQFKNTREVGETQHSSSIAPSVAAEHVHHHIHEIIQPVVQKETIQPSIIHTTIPIHEIHNNEAKFEKKTNMPAMSMEEFKKSGASVHGVERREDSFEGKPEGLGELINPKNKLGTIGGPGANGTTSMTGDLDPKVGPNRGSVPATSAQDHVTARNDGVTARDKIDTSLSHHQNKISNVPQEIPTTTTSHTKTPLAAGVPKTARFADTETQGAASSTNSVSPTYTTMPTSGSTTAKLDPRVDRVDNNSAHIVPRSEATRAKESEPAQKHGLLAKIKNALH